ncbi:MAG: hypothetical protein Q7O66_07525 [Dehalococcoidia bacterium]|nr:hypothetical protein [Dehalococcoidia bacterium]
MRRPVFTRHDDGRITVDAWQHRVTFSNTFLGWGLTNLKLGQVWRPVPNTVTITVANGRAVYQLDRPDAYGHWPGKLVEAEIETNKEGET